jgi:hypothetical protein
MSHPQSKFMIPKGSSGQMLVSCTALMSVSCRMFTARKKIVKELKDGKEAPLEAFEEQVAQVC